MNRTCVSAAVCVVMALAVQVDSAEARRRWRRPIVCVAPVVAPVATTPYVGLYNPYAGEAYDPYRGVVIGPVPTGGTFYRRVGDLDCGPELLPPHPCDDSLRVPDSGRPSYQYSQYYGAW